MYLVTRVEIQRVTLNEVAQEVRKEKEGKRKKR
jgi:hypothetical protein